ncbi:MAG TPA: LysM peptidoglycan-binding domain-containing M23 family metallopeptidase [Myxococcales bacterium]|nr:LysM peptidoglycan-binding domain-containing M23 family metallopeptidase [Myxococcales bacterium]
MGAARACARLTLIVCVCACAHRTVRPEEKAMEQHGAVHHVHAGETLWRIARTYGVPLEVVLRENALENPAQLAAGTSLFIPGAERELPVPPPDPPLPVHADASRRRSPSSIARAGGRPLDPAALGEPLAWPAPGVLISPFGNRERDHHDGIDLACPEGTAVRAAGDGIVLFSGEQRGYGNLVLLAHDHDLVTVYAHNAKNLVSQGDKVSRGEEIARVGKTGNATGPHLHFEVRVGTQPHDPLGFLR